MASYLPPTEDLPIFDNAVFEINNNPLTYNDAQKGFLAFPNAQGNENFQDITVYGTTDFLSIVTNQSTMPSPNDASEIVPTTQWVQDAITNAPYNPNITTTATSSATPLPIPILSTAIAGTASLFVDSNNGLTYTPSTNTLTTTTFSGSLSGTSISTNNVRVDNGGSGIMKIALTQGTTGYYPILTNVPTYDASTATINCNVFNGNLTGNATSATTATQVTISPNGNNATHYLTFSDTNTAGNINLHTNSGILVNPSTDTITAATFSGALSGIATNANAVNITQSSSATPLSIPLVSSSVGYNQIQIDDNFGITYTPSTNTLSVPVITSSTSITSPTVQTSNGGNLKVVNSTGNQSSTITEENNIMSITPSQLGANTLFINTNNSPVVAVGTTPTAYGGTNTGLGISWNTVGGTGATDFVNYAQSAGVGLGGFNFFSGSSLNAIASIGFIPRVQSAYSSASSIIIPTYNWVNGTISSAINAIPGITDYLVTQFNNPLDTTLYYPTWTSSTTTGDYPLFSTLEFYYQQSTNSFYFDRPVITTTFTPMIFAYGNYNTSEQFVNKIFYPSVQPTWSNPSGGVYGLTLNGPINSASINVTMIGNGGQRPYAVVTITYGGTAPNYTSVNFGLVLYAGTAGGGNPTNSSFSYTITGMIRP